jgi:hypothetical protein
VWVSLVSIVFVTCFVLFGSLQSSLFVMLSFLGCVYDSPAMSYVLLYDFFFLHWWTFVPFLEATVSQPSACKRARHKFSCLIVVAITFIVQFTIIFWLSYRFYQFQFWQYFMFVLNLLDTLVFIYIMQVRCYSRTGFLTE